jgi:hypothetical protein
VQCGAAFGAIDGVAIEQRRQCLRHPAFGGQRLQCGPGLAVDLLAGEAGVDRADLQGEVAYAGGVGRDEVRKALLGEAAGVGAEAV